MSGEGFYGGGTGEGFYTPLPIGEVVALVVAVPEVGVSAEVVAAGFVDVAVALVVPLPDVFEPTTLHSAGSVYLRGSARLRGLEAGETPLRAAASLAVGGSAALNVRVALQVSAAVSLAGSSWLTAAAHGRYTLVARSSVALGGRARLQTAGRYLPHGVVTWVADETTPPALLGLSATLAGFPFKMAQLSDLQIELDTAGGPLAASLTLAVPDLDAVPKLWADFRVTYEQYGTLHTLYRGRLERIETDVDTRLAYVLTFGSYMNKLRDRRDFRICAADEEFANWSRPVKTPLHDFNIDVTTANYGALGAGKIEALARWGSSYAGSAYLGNDIGAWGDVCWRLYDGVNTGDRIRHVMLKWKWNGIIDPALVKTDALPVYNLFPDPLGIASANPWKRAEDTYGDFISYQDPDNPGVRLASNWVEYATTSYQGNVLLNGVPGSNPRCNGFVFADAHLPSVPLNKQGLRTGASVWECQMALPADMAAHLAKGETIPMRVGLWALAIGGNSDSLTGADEQGVHVTKPELIRAALERGDLLPERMKDWQHYLDTSGLAPPTSSPDACYLMAVDKVGGVLGVCEAFRGPLPQDGLYHFYSTGFTALPQDTVTIMLLITWQTKLTDAQATIWRNVALPCVTNAWDVYHDGNSPGWMWTGSKGTSASRETDETVTRKVLEKVAQFEGRPPIQALLFEATDPTDPGPWTDPANHPMPKVLHQWTAAEKAHGTLNVGCSSTGLGLAIMVVGCPYTLTFLQPKTKPMPDPVGLTITAFNVNGPSSAGEVLGEICRWGGLRASGKISDSLPELYFKDLPKDGWDALDEVNAICGCDYFCWDGETVEFRTPGSGAKRTLQVDDPATVWSPETDLAETWNSVVVTYNNKAGLPREVTCGSGGRRDVIAAPKSVTDAGSARAIGQAYLAAHTGAELNGRMTIYGDQNHVDALLFRPGDMLTIQGPAKSIVTVKPQEVIHVSLRPLTWEAQLQFGVNSKRYDMLIARLMAGGSIARR